MRQLLALSVPQSGAEESAKLASTSPKAHLFRFYPQLLDISFLDYGIPTMWVLPSEYARLFPPPASPPINGEEHGEEDTEADVGDGADLIEVSARELARWCLVIIGKELGLGTQ